ncbi:MAG: hypothetical protein LBH68_00235, partial [Bifidobacteriaceae bacterium]|nr:hypothetical protein [Bifidobacteriaceae bacterium]
MTVFYCQQCHAALAPGSGPNCPICGAPVPPEAAAAAPEATPEPAAQVLPPPLAQPGKHTPVRGRTDRPMPPPRPETGRSAGHPNRPPMRRSDAAAGGSVGAVGGFAGGADGGAAGQPTGGAGAADSVPPSGLNPLAGAPPPIAQPAPGAPGPRTAAPESGPIDLPHYPNAEEPVPVRLLSVEAPQRRRAAA